MPATVRVPKSLTGHSPSESVTLRTTAGRLSPHFRVDELACPCDHCERVVIHWALVELLQRMRWRIGRPLIVTSGFRCASHNTEIGGVSSSLHISGLAADLQCEGLTPEMLFDVARECGAGGIGLYPRHLHVDIGKRRQWRGNYD